jgi:hypothetical protein
MAIGVGALADDSPPVGFDPHVAAAPLSTTARERQDDFCSEFARSIAELFVSLARVFV